MLSSTSCHLCLSCSTASHCCDDLGHADHVALTVGAPSVYGRVGFHPYLTIVTIGGVRANPDERLNDGPLSGEAPGGEAPGGGSLGGEAPGGEALSGEAPGGEAPGGEAPGDEAPSGEAPSVGALANYVCQMDHFYYHDCSYRSCHLDHLYVLPIMVDLARAVTAATNALVLSRTHLLASCMARCNRDPVASAVRDADADGSVAIHSIHHRSKDHAISAMANAAHADSLSQQRNMHLHHSHHSIPFLNSATVHFASILNCDAG